MFAPWSFLVHVHAAELGLEFLELGRQFLCIVKSTQCLKMGARMSLL